MTDTPNPATDPSRRTKPETFRARNLMVSLTVDDLRKSLEWYRDIVDFTVAEEHEQDGEVISVSLVAGNVRLLLNQDDGAQGSDRTKGVGFSFYLNTAQDIDELAARIRERGGELEADPADMPWGGRLFRLRDPDGFRLAISSI